MLGGPAGLGDNPEMGSLHDDVGQEVRAMLVEHHVVYYRILANSIEVLRILHERMDAARHLAGR